MYQLLCRNRVADFETWKQVFDSCAEAQAAAGLRTVSMWRCQDEPNNVFFLFDVENLDRAHAFLNAPESKEAGEQSGVLDGECHMVSICDV